MRIVCSACVWLGREDEAVSHFRSADHFKACQKLQDEVCYYAWACKICGEVLGEDFEYEHCQSAQHADNFERVQGIPWQCSLCNFRCSNERNFDEHLRGRNHKHMEDEMPGDSANYTPGGTLYCNLCRWSGVDEPGAVKRHFQGNEHIDNARDLLVIGRSVCVECGIICTSDEQVVASHKKGRQHQTRMQLLFPEREACQPYQPHQLCPETIYSDMAQLCVSVPSVQLSSQQHPLHNQQPQPVLQPETLPIKQLRQHIQPPQSQILPSPVVSEQIEVCIPCGTSFFDRDDLRLHKAAKAHKDQVRMLLEDVMGTADADELLAYVPGYAPRGSTSGQPRPVSLEELLTCPISHSMMEDPVVAADGHSYERSQISQWLHDHDTSPMTGQTLSDVVLVDNVALKAIIRRVDG